MKNKISIFILCLFSAFFLSSCEDFLGGDTNIDPTRTNDASLNTLLPTVIFYTGQSAQSNAYVASQYVQQLGSVSAGGTDALFRNEFASQWVNLYLNVIPNCNIIIKKAQASNSPYYSGVAKILLAYNLGIATTTWENVPYKEADNNLTNFSPKYDSQESIYAAALNLLNEGIGELGQAASLFSPATDDLVYKGDKTKWIKLANTLRARYLLHLLKKQGTGNLAQIKEALSKGLSSNADDFQLIYTERNFNPWHSVALANNTGNLSVTFGGQWINYLNGTQYSEMVDPRLPLMAFKTGTNPQYIGVVAGKGSTGSNTVFNDRTAFYGWFCRVDAPVQMVTYSEAKFIEAETQFLTGGGTRTSVGTSADVQAAFAEGIRANMQKIGVSAANITTYLNGISKTADKLTLSDIMVEKYKSLFVNPEVWVDVRRYDSDPTIYKNLTFPETPNVDVKGAWITRGVYPTSETSRNSEVTKANFKDLNQKMWIFQ
jgi:hypothetical protein